jgi:hypothetical protein
MPCASPPAHDQKPSAKPQKVSGTAKSAAQIRPAPLGATVESVLLAGRQLNPALRAAALDTTTAAAKAAGADALERPRGRAATGMTGEVLSATEAPAEIDPGELIFRYAGRCRETAHAKH